MNSKIILFVESEPNMDMVYSCIIISVITKKFNFQIMIKMTQFYDDFHAQNVPQVWKTGSKLRYVDRLTP